MGFQNELILIHISLQLMGMFSLTSGNTPEASVGCHSISCPRGLFNLERRGSGKHFFLRCFVKQTCYHEKLSGNVTNYDAHVGH